MKDVVLVTNYWHFENEKASSRYRSLANLIVENKMKLEIITSSFYHLTKEQRNYTNEFLNSFKYRITLINEKGYTKNISIRRILSHKVFAKNVIKYLKRRRIPDIIYLVVPSLDVADLVSKFAKENSIPLIIDIQDLWPEAFKMAINIPYITNILFKPLANKANRIYNRADKIVAVSDTYVKRGLLANKNDHIGLSVYIGNEFDYANNCIEKNKLLKPNNEFWVTYVGALGHSYDIKLVIDSLEILKNKGITNIIFKVLGSGVLMEEFKEYADMKSVNVDFMGQVEYGKMMGILHESDIAVNPIIGKSVASIINKVADYATAGVPVINTQNCNEYRDIVQKYNIGLNCDSGDAYGFAEKIKKLYDNKKLCNEMSKNSIILAKELFDRNKTYIEIVKLIKSMG